MSTIALFAFVNSWIETSSVLMEKYRQCFDNVLKHF